MAAALVDCERKPDAIVRHAIGKFPIATAIEVPAAYNTIYVSGMGVDVADKTAAPMTLEAYGDTKTQTRSALNTIQVTLAEMHLGQVGDAAADANGLGHCPVAEI